MGSLGDFLQLLGLDISTNILSYLDDPADVVRASSVSHSWHQFVIENGFSKRLCLKIFPDVLNATHAIEVDDVIQLMKVDSNNSKVFENSEKNHKVYAFLARGLSPTLRKDCISLAIRATSTDNYPLERIQNTLARRDRIRHRPSYWSSAGDSDDGKPERLTYKLISELCFITEINIQPFQVYFHHGFPIYSAKFVRFRMGHLKLPLHVLANEHHDDDCFEWTYVSPEYPMTQENCLQHFKLPAPVLCIGGTLQIELLGRAQRCWDGLFYICVSHVQVVGRTLLPGYDVASTDHPGKCVVNYSPQGENKSSKQRAKLILVHPSASIYGLAPSHGGLQ